MTPLNIGDLLVHVHGEWGRVGGGGCGVGVFFHRNM